MKMKTCVDSLIHIFLQYRTPQTTESSSSFRVLDYQHYSKISKIITKTDQWNNIKF